MVELRCGLLIWKISKPLKLSTCSYGYFSNFREIFLSTRKPTRCVLFSHPSEIFIDVLKLPPWNLCRYSLVCSQIVLITISLRHFKTMRYPTGATRCGISTWLIRSGKALFTYVTNSGCASLHDCIVTWVSHRGGWVAGRGEGGQVSRSFRAAAAVAVNSGRLRPPSSVFGHRATFRRILCEVSHHLIGRLRCARRSRLLIHCNFLR